MASLKWKPDCNPTGVFDWKLPVNHAISILKADHDTFRSLFDQFPAADKPDTRQSYIQNVTAALRIHSILEDELFYPAVRTHVGSEMINAAARAHQLAEDLIVELQHCRRESDPCDSKFMTLAAIVRQQIEEEECKMFPKVKDLDIRFEALGEEMLDRRQALLNMPAPEEQSAVMDDR